MPLGVPFSEEKRQFLPSAQLLHAPFTSLPPPYSLVGGGTQYCWMLTRCPPRQRSTTCNRCQMPTDPGAESAFLTHIHTPEALLQISNKILVIPRLLGFSLPPPSVKGGRGGDRHPVLHQPQRAEEKPPQVTESQRLPTKEGQPRSEYSRSRLFHGAATQAGPAGSQDAFQNQDAFRVLL